MQKHQLIYWTTPIVFLSLFGIIHLIDIKLNEILQFSDFCNGLYEPNFTIGTDTLFAKILNPISQFWLIRGFGLCLCFIGWIVILLIFKLINTQYFGGPSNKKNNFMIFAFFIFFSFSWKQIVDTEPNSLFNELFIGINPSDIYIKNHTQYIKLNNIMLYQTYDINKCYSNGKLIPDKPFVIYPGLGLEQFYQEMTFRYNHTINSTFIPPTNLELYFREISYINQNLVNCSMLGLYLNANNNFRYKECGSNNSSTWCYSINDGPWNYKIIEETKDWKLVSSKKMKITPECVMHLNQAFNTETIVWTVTALFWSVLYLITTFP